MGRRNYVLFLTGLIVTIILGGVSPPLLHASVEVVYQTDDVDTIKVDDPHVTDVVSNSYGELIFPTDGTLSAGDTFQVVIYNGESGSSLNEVRFSTGTSVLSLSTIEFVSWTDGSVTGTSGVNIKDTNSDSIWNGTPVGSGFGFNLNNTADVDSGKTVTYTFQITSGSLSYLDFTSGIDPAKGTTDADLDSYFSLKWKQDVTTFQDSNGLKIPADGLFSQHPGDVIISTNEPVDQFFNASGIASGTSGISETTVSVYGAISEKTIQSVDPDNTTLRLTKTESFTSVVPTANTVGIVVDLQSGMKELLNQKIADTISMGGTVDQVMALSLQIGAGSLTALTYGTEWDYGYDSLSNPDRLFAYLIPGTYGTDPFFLGTDYYFQLDFLNYADTFGTANFSNIVGGISGEQGIVTAVPEIPKGVILPLSFILSLLVFYLPRVLARKR
jgi:hypothetical protein